jgi:hypothetical protein
VALIPKLAGLAPGTYSATVSITPLPPPELSGVQGAPTAITVNVTASSAPLISADPISWSFTPGGAFLPPANPATAWVFSNGGPVPFKVVPPPGADWLTIAPLSGTTPAVLTFTADTSGFDFHANYSTPVTVEGPNNSATIPISVLGTGLPFGAPITTVPPGLAFLLSSAPGTSESRAVYFMIAGQVSSQTQDGGKWLSAILSPSPNYVNVTASTANLSAGTYHGAVTAPGRGGLRDAYPDPALAALQPNGSSSAVVSIKDSMT